jgi:putative transposase
LIPDVDHNSRQYANNKAELSHQVTRIRVRGMRKFKSVTQANRFLSAHKEVYNLFNLGRNLIAARHYRDLREGAFASWNRVVAVYRMGQFSLLRNSKITCQYQGS